jgi:hypothetical protein
VVNQDQAGAITIHPPRLPVTREVINSALASVQKKLKLATGMNGEWTREADEVLARNLAAAKRGSGMTAPKQQKELLALRPHQHRWRSQHWRKATAIPPVNRRVQEQNG